jgi:hypothetical protein
MISAETKDDADGFWLLRLPNHAQSLLDLTAESAGEQIKLG